MDTQDEFVDYYALLSVERDCERAVIEKAYRQLAQLYHPDHTETADVDKFQEATLAYRTLKDSARRAEYDRIYAEHHGEEPPPPPKREDIVIDGTTAVQDAEIHEQILLALYKQRRENAREPGLMPYYVQRGLDCSDESFEFHTWYLKSKGYIEITQQSELAITIEGVDHVITSSRAAKERLLLEQAKDRAAE